MPFMFYGCMGMAAGLYGAYRAGTPVVWLGLMGLFAQMVAGCASLTCLWVLLVGANAIYSQPALRVAAIVLLLSGLADALYFLTGQSEVNAQIMSSATSILMWAGVLGLPMLVGARHLYLLLFRIPETARTQTGV
jgi:hypothetical protein